MITTELSNIQGLISSNAKLSVGVDFLRLMRTEGLLEASKGLFPAICGGAVRNGLFTGREINDIDVFLFRDSRSPAYQGGLDTTTALLHELTEVRQNILSWLEDQEIEWQSLLSDAASAYFGSQQFLEIVQFVWREVTIQIMIPTSRHLSNGIDHLMRTMPLYSAVALTMDYVRVYDLALANYCLPRNQYFVGTERDIPYLRHKFPGGVYLPVSGSREASVAALSFFIESAPLADINMNDSQMMGINSTNSLLKRAYKSKFPDLTDDQIQQGPVAPTNVS